MRRRVINILFRSLVSFRYVKRERERGRGREVKREKERQREKRHCIETQ